MKRCRYAFKALGSVFSISVFTSDEPLADAAVSAAKAAIDDFEAEFSRFRPDSCLSTLNTIGKLRVSERFERVVAACLEANRLTCGYFNPFVDVSRIGYARSFEEGGFSISETPEAPVPDFSTFRIEGGGAVLPTGAKLDFWAVGKGFLADEIADLLRRRGFSNFVLDFGGDVVAGGFDAFGHPHRIGISSPFAVWEAIGAVSVSNGSVSTSGSSVRLWKTADGREFHHLRSPYGRQRDGLASVTVLTSKGYMSDALATGLFAAGWEEGFEIARDGRIEAVFIASDGKIASTVLDESVHRLSMR